MKYLKISNIGLLDERLIYLMGGTTKRGDNNTIGQFGTGLKYATCWLLNNNIDFKVFIGEREVKIETRKETIRDKEFEKVFINGIDTSMTTLMGAEWKPYYIIREIWANSKDESDAKKEITSDVKGAPERTTFYIQLTPEIQNVVDNWSLYFKDESDALFGNDSFKVYSASDKLRVYKQGFLVYEAKGEQKCVFNYDLPYVDINELRVVSHIPSWKITRGLFHLNKKWAVYFIENLTEDCYEWEADYDNFDTPSKEFISAIGNNKVIDSETYDKLIAREEISPECDHFVRLPKSLFKKISTVVPSVSALRVSSDNVSFYEIENPEIHKSISKA